VEGKSGHKPAKEAQFPRAGRDGLARHGRAEWREFGAGLPPVCM